jgi:hypothetical protein
MKSGECRDLIEGEEDLTEGYMVAVTEGDSKNAIRNILTLAVSVDEFETNGGP